MVNRAHYKVNGKVLSLPVTGEGECQFIWSKFLWSEEIDLIIWMIALTINNFTKVDATLDCFVTVTFYFSTSFTDNCTARVDHRIKEVNIKGKKYLQTRSLTVNVDVKSGEMKYYNLFNDNKELGRYLHIILLSGVKYIFSFVKTTIYMG